MQHSTIGKILSTIGGSLTISLYHQPLPLTYLQSLALVKRCMEYGSTVWSPHAAKNINLLESVQCIELLDGLRVNMTQPYTNGTRVLKGTEVAYTGILMALSECCYASLYYE